ncbi:Rieske (2Fe-2S) protein [Janthinobacterium sp. HLX7-2]|uniref:Rieske (2Fe-2S) protein n=1 Tax=Janthinobacterium sp. HLX7-2 TaxID=1259331 RepID=UPI003F2947E2
MSMRRYRLCMADEICEGQARGFDPLATGRDVMFVVRKQGRLYAYRNACPHIDGAPMAWARHQYLNANGSRIVCSAHGAQFDIESGVCLLGPCLGQALEPITIERACDSELYILLPASVAS